MEDVSVSPSLLTLPFKKPNNNNKQNHKVVQHIKQLPAMLTSHGALVHALLAPLLTQPAPCKCTGKERGESTSSGPCTHMGD